MWAGKQFSFSLQLGTFVKPHIAVLHPLGTDSTVRLDGSICPKGVAEVPTARFIPMPEKPWRTGLFLHLMNTCACAGPVLSAGRKTWPKPQALESRERLTHIHHPKRGTCCPRVPLLPAASLFSVSQWNVLWEWLWILKPQTLQCSGAEWASL